MSRTLSKEEIARRQIDGAIILHMRGGDPVVVMSLLKPASQILRDLNRNNRGSLSFVLTKMFEKSGIKPEIFWKAINETAAKLKHGRDPFEVIDEEELVRDIPYELMFCMTEWMFRANSMNWLIVTPYMATYAKYRERSDRRLLVNNKLNMILNTIDRRITIEIIRARQAVLIGLHAILLRLFVP